MTTIPKTKKTIFFQIKSNQEKLARIVQVAKQKFDEKLPLLFLMQDTKGAEFIDNFLWSHPVHSLLPHEFCLTTSEEIICISIAPNNPNNAKHIFNLTSDPLLEVEDGTVYEFEDLTTPEKTSLSKQKYHLYREAKFALASF